MSTQVTSVAAQSIFTDAHTAYRFTDAPVSDDELAQVYELTKFTPTAMNSQPLRILFVRTPTAKQRLLPLLNESNRAKAASAPVSAILAADVDFHVHLGRLNPQTSAEVRDRLGAHEEGRVAMARNNAWLQAGAFILAARAAGLDVGPMGGVNAEGIDGEFFPGSSLRTFLVANLGHVAPDGSFPRNPRLDFDQAVTLV